MPMIGLQKRDGVCNPVTHVSKTIKTSKRFGRGCKPRPARILTRIFGCFKSNRLKRDGVCNPVTHVSKTIKTSKRFGRGCKPRPAPLQPPTGTGDDLIKIIANAVNIMPMIGLRKETTQSY